MRIRFTKTAEKELSKMDAWLAVEILRFLKKRIALLPDPRTEGRALTGKWQGFWRYRYGKYRIICDIVDNELMIIVVKIGKRDEVYS